MNSSTPLDLFAMMLYSFSASEPDRTRLPVALAGMVTVTVAAPLLANVALGPLVRERVSLLSSYHSALL